jgi:UDP-3-O-[3-hydroxymyristoyl] glucosamine N-acyltransferase
LTLGEIAVLINGTLEGPSDLPILRVAQPDSNDAAAIGFAESEKFIKLAEGSQIGALVVPFGASIGHKPVIRVEEPRRAFHLVLQQFQKSVPIETGVHPTAVVHESAKIDPSASIGAYCVLSENTVVEANVRVYPFCFIGPDCVLEKGAVLYPNVVLYGWVRVGKDSIVHAGCVLGADGFGFVWDGSRRIKVPQVGSVEIGDEVEIGALSAVDRATMGATVVGHRTKIDNLVQIGHNVRIGEDCAIAAQAGVSGSARVGDRVVLAGQCGVADGIVVGSDTSFGGRSAVVKDTPEPGTYLGYPARPIAEEKRSMLLAQRLPELLARLRKLERKADEA